MTMTSSAMMMSAQIGYAGMIVNWASALRIATITPKLRPPHRAAEHAGARQHQHGTDDDVYPSPGGEVDDQYTVLHEHGEVVVDQRDDPLEDVEQPDGDEHDSGEPDPADPSGERCPRARHHETLPFPIERRTRDVWLRSLVWNASRSFGSLFRRRVGRHDRVAQAHGSSPEPGEARRGTTGCHDAAGSGVGIIGSAVVERTGGPPTALWCQLRRGCGDGGATDSGTARPSMTASWPRKT